MTGAETGGTPPDGLHITGLRKRYGAHEVLTGVDLHVPRGSVHALLGPNGAGKSTLIKCVNGAVAWDDGSVRLDGTELTGLTPAAARAAGIVTIHQHLSVVDALSVADNVFLGRELRRGPLIDRTAQRGATARLLSTFGLDVSPETPVGRLGAGQRQLVEIVKAFGEGDVRVLILDEPTTSLSTPESELLFGEIIRLRAAGVCVVYVTHRLGEVFRIADGVTVMKNGGVAFTGAVRDVTPGQLTAALSGEISATERTSVPGRPVLRLSGLTGPRFGPVDLTAHAGEVLGLFGAIGAGRTSLLETVAGRHRPTAGKIHIDTAGTARPGSAGHTGDTVTAAPGALPLTGAALRPAGPRAALRAGIALVPGDRIRHGLWHSESSTFNALLPHLRGLLRSPAAERDRYSALARDLGVHPADPARPVGTLSGGNAQKVLVGRWLLAADQLRALLVDEPTNGVDIGARAQIHAALRAAADRGATVVMSSGDADEHVRYADRVLVMADGRIVADLVGPDITADALLAAAHQLVPTEPVGAS